MSGEEIRVKNKDLNLWQNAGRDIKFYIDGKEKLKITPEGHYVDGRLAANDTEVYEAFKAFLAAIKR